MIVITVLRYARGQNHDVLEGEKGCQEFMQSNGEKHQHACLLAHDVVNKLSAIIGFCDLLVENAEQPDTECATRLTSIRELAKSAAKQLIDHQCELSVLIRSTKPAKRLFV